MGNITVQQSPVRSCGLLYSTNFIDLGDQVPLNKNMASWNVWTVEPTKVFVNYRPFFENLELFGLNWNKRKTFCFILTNKQWKIYLNNQR